MALRWTEEQVRDLRDKIGSYGWRGLIRAAGLSDDRFGGTPRSKKAVGQKAARMFGGGITRGSYSVVEAMRETGYAETQLRRAASALNQSWCRTGKGGNFLITGEQLEDMAAWLQHDFWSVALRLYACRGCNRRDVPHFTGGQCVACHRRCARRAQALGISRYSLRGLRPLFASPTEDHRLVRLRDALNRRLLPLFLDLELVAALAQTHGSENRDQAYGPAGLRRCAVPHDFAGADAGGAE